MDDVEYIKYNLILIFIITTLIFISEVHIAFARYYTEWNHACFGNKKTVEAYLMVAESRCKEDARSKAGAQGFWQLMPATGKAYGCDDLYNLECSTRAAARYIKSLEARFNTFEEVIIAYNMGGHNYQKYGKSAQALGLVRRVKMIQKADK